MRSNEFLRTYGRLFGVTVLLLVVIAIIGILAAIILVNLNTARQKGKDAAIQTQLSSARAQAEIYYDQAQTYGSGTTSVCNDGANSLSSILAKTPGYTCDAGGASSRKSSQWSRLRSSCNG